MKLNCCSNSQDNSKMKVNTKQQNQKNQLNDNYDEISQLYKFKEQYTQQQSIQNKSKLEGMEQSKSIIKVPIESLQNQNDCQNDQGEEISEHSGTYNFYEGNTGQVNNVKLPLQPGTKINQRYNSILNDNQQASSFSLKTQYVICYLCNLEICNDFISLPCLHTFCYKCLLLVITQQLQKKSSFLHCLCGKRLKPQILDQYFQNQLVKEQLFHYQLLEISNNLKSKWKCQNCDFFCILNEPKQDRIYCPNCFEYYLSSSKQGTKLLQANQIQKQIKNNQQASQLSLKTQYMTCYQCKVEICIDFISLPCLHIFCFQCLNQEIVKQLQNSKAILRCLCGKRLSPQILNQFCSNKQFDLLKEQLYNHQLFEIINNLTQKWKCQKCDFFCILMEPKCDRLYCPNCLEYYQY